MICFQCDYAEGCHPSILNALTRTNFEQTSGYGTDDYCATAAKKLKELCQAPDSEVHFLVGGTQTNRTVISSILRPWQGVISADSGHIAMHETGAIEASGHKVLTIPSQDGTLSATAIASLCESYFTSGTQQEHIVQPGMVYISHPTENGTLYTKRQLEDISAVCRQYRLPLFLDGARLGYGLTAQNTDVTLPLLAELCDVFYVGGTKCGALFGEAVIISNPALTVGFRNMIKQTGGLLAKGRLLGLQFDTLFTDNLYFDICRHAVEQALQIRTAFEEKGIPLFMHSPTNQQFPILTLAQREALDTQFVCEFWEPASDDRQVVRFCTSWATRDEDIATLISAIHALEV